MANLPKRTSEGLRDVLFNEIEELQLREGDPRRALAVSNLARQIINTVRVELEFAKGMQEIRAAGGDATLGTLPLGKNADAASAAATATAHSSVTRLRGRAK